MSNIPQDLRDEYGVGEGCILNLKPNRHVKVMAGEIQCLIERIARLTEENAMLKAPVSDEEWLDNSVCESHDYRNRADRSQVDALLAARSKPQEGNDAIPPTQV